MLKYSLVENSLVSHQNDYLARTHVRVSYDKTKFIKRLLGKGTLMTETDAIAALNAIENTIIDIIKEGGTLNLPLLNTSFSISGVFDSPFDNFDSKRHKLNINLTKGTLLRAAEKQISIKKTHAVSPHPSIVEIKDIFSGEINKQLTSNGVIEIIGYHIKITGDDPSCGLWFVGNHAEIKADILLINKPSTVTAIIPKLDNGKYQLKIVTQYSSSHLLKSSKTHIYPVILEVL